MHVRGNNVMRLNGRPYLQQVEVVNFTTSTYPLVGIQVKSNFKCFLKIDYHGPCGVNWMIRELSLSDKEFHSETVENINIRNDKTAKQW